MFVFYYTKCRRYLSLVWHTHTQYFLHFFRLQDSLFFVYLNSGWYHNTDDFFAILFALNIFTKISLCLDRQTSVWSNIYVCRNIYKHFTHTLCASCGILLLFLSHQRRTTKKILSKHIQTVQSRPPSILSLKPNTFHSTNRVHTQHIHIFCNLKGN